MLVLGLILWGGALTWTGHLDNMHAAVEAARWEAARAAWRDAYGAAARSGTWQALLTVGQAAHALKDRTAVRRATRAALARAERQRSVEGVLGAADVFEALGDREVADACLAVARRLASDLPDPRLGALVTSRVAEILARRQSPAASIATPP